MYRHHSQTPYKIQRKILCTLTMLVLYVQALEIVTETGILLRSTSMIGVIFNIIDILLPNGVLSRINQMNITAVVYILGKTMTDAVYEYFQN